EEPIQSLRLLPGLSHPALFPPQELSMKYLLRSALCCAVIGATAFAQQKNPPKPQVEKTSPNESISSRTPNTEEAHNPSHEERPSQEAHAEGNAQQKGIHWDMTETAPVVTHHEINVNGKSLHYTATVGR